MHADHALLESLEKSGAIKSVAALADWKAWSFDKLLMQSARPDVQRRLAATSPHALEAIRAVETALEDLAAAPSMNRRLRKLETISARELTAV